MLESHSCSHFITAVGLNFLWASESLVKLLKTMIFGGLITEFLEVRLRHMFMQREHFILKNETCLKVGS